MDKQKLLLARLSHRWQAVFNELNTMIDSLHMVLTGESKYLEDIINTIIGFEIKQPFGNYKSHGLLWEIDAIKRAAAFIEDEHKKTAVIEKLKYMKKMIIRIYETITIVTNSKQFFDELRGTASEFRSILSSNN